MKNSKTLILLVALILVSACKKDKENLTENTSTEEISQIDSLDDAEQDSIIVDNSNLPLDTFGALAEIQDCSCYFAKSKADFQEKKYIYADDYGNNAYVKINEKIVQIPLEEGDFDLDEFERQVENKDYIFEMKAKKQENNSDKMIYRGEITITNKSNGEQSKSSIYGECNC